MTKSSGLENIGIYERINVVDFFSKNQGDQTEINDDEALEMENKVIFAYNMHTSQISIQYYYWYVCVNSERGRVLLGKINHQYANSEENETILAKSTFMFKGNFWSFQSY